MEQTSSNFSNTTHPADSQLTDAGISPAYYTSEGKIQTNSSKVNEDGSPVYNDQSRVFYSHSVECSCRGSGVGCECTKFCSCKN